MWRRHRVTLNVNVSAQRVPWVTSVELVFAWIRLRLEVRTRPHHSIRDHWLMICHCHYHCLPSPPLPITTILSWNSLVSPPLPIQPHPGQARAILVSLYYKCKGPRLLLWRWW